SSSVGGVEDNRMALSGLNHLGNPEAARHTALSRAAAIVAIIYALAILVPWNARILPVSARVLQMTDPSWQMALHEAFVHRLQHGRQIVFTYGPWGFILTRMYHPGTYRWMLLAWAIIALTFF